MDTTSLHRYCVSLCLLVMTACLALPLCAQTNADIQRLNNEIELLKRELRKSNSGSDRATQDRLARLEMAVEELKENIGSRAIAHAFEGIKLDIGGFLHSAYTYVDTDDVGLGSFNRQNFELLIGAELTDSWSAFIAGGFLRESDDPFAEGSRTDPKFDTNNRNPLIIGWANYRKADMFNVRIGRMITPHGIINIQHFPATLYDPEQPQFLRPFGGNTIFPNFSTGIQAHGKHFGSVLNFEYAAYLTNATGVGNMQANSEELSGARFALGSANGLVTLGLNFSDAYRGTTDSDYTMQGADLHINAGLLEIKTEYYETQEEQGGDREAYYVQPILQLTDRWSVFYRYDFLNAGEVYGQSTENVVGINYAPTYNIRFRLTSTQKEFEEGFTNASLSAPLGNSEANILQVSGTFSF